MRRLHYYIAAKKNCFQKLFKTIKADKGQPGSGSHGIAYGRPRADASAYTVEDLMALRSAAPWPGSEGAVPLPALRR